MINVDKVAKLFKEHVDFKVYSKTVPKNADYPCGSFRHRANSAARLLNGEESGRSDTWLVTLYVKDTADIKTVVDQVKKIHNLQNEDFQRVLVTIGALNDSQSDESIQVINISMQTFEGK